MNAPISPIPTSRAIRFLLAHLRPHALSLALGFVVLVGVDLIQLVIPRIIQKILDRHSPARGRHGGVALFMASFNRETVTPD
jgi:hypothetical protein